MWKFLFFCLFLQFWLGHGFAQGLEIEHPLCNYKADPMGVETIVPHLSWQLISDKRGVKQQAYQVLVSDDLALLENNTGNIWNSGKVISDSSVRVAYKGARLNPAELYYWKVKVWDNKQDSSWSRISKWQMGLFDVKDWKGAHWIAYNKMADSDRILPGDNYNKHEQRNDTLPLFRKDFLISKTLKRATVFISGLGQFELYLNGKKVGDHFLDPGWTQYEKEALYVAFDITKELKKGENALGVMLGNGFYYIPVWRHRYRKLTLAYGYPQMICLVRLDYADGSTSYITSDTSWKTTPGPIVFSSIYGGEDYNANLERPGWDNPGFDADGWENAVRVQGPPELHSQMTAPVKVMKKFAPIKVYKSEDRRWVYDLGQNASGIPEITVQGQKGDTVKIIPAEVLNREGEVSQKGSGGPSYFTYILKGEGPETWHPRFSYYGFRYLAVEGAVPKGNANHGGIPVVQELQGLHVSNAAKKTGSFSCSNDLFNHTYHLIKWAISNNMMSLFTDCPHREKLGWMEQMNLMGPSVHYNFDIPNLFIRTIKNMEDAQTADGLVPEIAPEYVRFSGFDRAADFRDSPEWGSSSIIVPWYMYKWYGDKQILNRSYAMMKKYMNYLGTKAQDNILYFGLSDWYDLGPDRPGFSQLTPDGVTATAYYYYDLNLMQKIAGLLGKNEEASTYEQLAKKVKNSFNKTFFHEDTGEYATGSQTANAMAVYMKLVPEKYKREVINNIVKDIQKRNYSFTSGDIGFRFLLKVLDEAGRSDVIFKMNNRSDVPGYGYQLEQGATALTESWIASPSVSNDHFMLGHIMEWFYDRLGGINQTDSSVAYRQFLITPEPVGDLTSAEASFNSPYGQISSKWNINKKVFNLSVEIPANSSSIIAVPVKEGQQVTVNDTKIDNLRYINLIRKTKDKMYFKTGSGKYTFVVK